MEERKVNAEPKRLFVGTHRSKPLEDTLASVLPRLRDYGITRVGNITGLDVLGIPVFASFRPNSRSLSVAQGKGLTNDAARVSAIMESIEHFHAEYAQCPCVIDTYEDLCAHTNVASPDQLPLRVDTLFSESRPIPWTLGRDLIEQREIFVPYELVHLNATVPRVPGSGCFCSGSNGLASGNSFNEAVVHGLCEIIERDAIALWQARGPSHWALTQVDLQTVDDPDSRELLSCFDAARCPVIVWDATSDAGVATFYAAVFDEGTQLLRPLPAAFGSGCHLDRRIALCRALTEAAQSRLTVIAGSRDDLSRERYVQFQSPHAMAFHARLLRRQLGEPLNFRNVPTSVHGDLGEDLNDLLARVCAVGCARVIVVDLSRPSTLVFVVRVIVPGLEGPAQVPAAKAGPRLRRWLDELIRLSRTDA